MSKTNHRAISSLSPTRRQMIFGSAATIGGLAVGAMTSWAADAGEISHSAESIHQEPVFQASPSRVYEALTVASQFDKVVKVSAAMQSGTISAAKPTIISLVPGGGFSLFGGYITGRTVEFVPDKRIVQAWRDGGWDAGLYSIVKFELIAQGSGTRLIFDQAGFPQGDADHLAAGWHDNYWKPLARVLA